MATKYGARVEPGMVIDVAHHFEQAGIKSVMFYPAVAEKVTRRAVTVRSATGRTVVFPRAWVRPHPEGLEACPMRWRRSTGGLVVKIYPAPGLCVRRAKTGRLSIRRARQK